MNELQIFDSPKFGQIRTIMQEDGKPLFCGSDVAKALGYVNSRKALTDHCKGVTKRDTPTAGGIQSISYIPEGDVYRLITHSKLPAAEQFESWVFDEVLPSIRKHGVYANAETAERLMSDPDFMIKTFTALKEEREARRALETQVNKDKPKVLFADSVAASHTSILVGDLAKLIQQNGVAVGGTRLFNWLRENGFLIKRKGADWNMPTQRSMEQGLFEIKETVVSHADGHTSINKTPKVTGKGQCYFVNRFLTPDVAQ